MSQLERRIKSLESQQGAGDFCTHCPPEVLRVVFVEAVTGTDVPALTQYEPCPCGRLPKVLHAGFEKGM
jgi:hypothetical protein